MHEGVKGGRAAEVSRPWQVSASGASTCRGTKQNKILKGENKMAMTKVVFNELRRHLIMNEGRLNSVRREIKVANDEIWSLKTRIADQERTLAKVNRVLGGKLSPTSKTTLEQQRDLVQNGINVKKGELAQKEMNLKQLEAKKVELEKKIAELEQDLR